MKKVLVLRGKTRYDVLTEAADRIADGFRARGYEVEEMDLDRCDTAALIKMSMPYSFLFSCQALGFEIELPGGEPLVKALPNAYIGWIFDDVIYHGARVQHACYDNTYLLAIDKECGRAIKKMYPAVKHINVLHHGGFCATGTGEEELEAAFWKENVKDIPILFPANLGEEPPFSWYLENAAQVESFLAGKVMELLEKRPYLAIRRALELVLKELGEELTGELLHELDNMIYMIDAHIRWQSRYDILLALLEAGLPVTVAGSGEIYEQLAGKYPGQLNLVGGTDILDVVQLMARSRIVINPCPVLTEGLHERLLTSLLLKAVCFTPWTNYLDANFGACFDFIELDNLDKMTQEISFILEHPEAVTEQIEANYVYAMEYHTWKRRGEEIIDFYESQIEPSEKKRENGTD